MLIIAKYICGNTFEVNSVFNGCYINFLETSKAYELEQGEFILIHLQSWEVVGQNIISRREQVSFL
jgi:hypothetical protein